MSISNNSKIMTRVKKASSEHGFKMTITRTQILATILKSKKALSAYEVADQVKLDFERSIPTMSVYRILKVLTDANLIHKISSVNRYVACSHIACDHQHQFARFLICSKCFKVKELMTQGDTVRGIHKDIEGSGFEVINDQVELNCVCSICATID